MADQNKAWGFPIQWARSYGEEIRFRTEIITSRNGKEQRIAQRVKPRLAYDFESFLNFKDFQKAARLLAENQGKEIAVPHPRRRAELTAETVRDVTTTRAVSFTIDDSGSMGVDGKINTMKTAMNAVFDELSLALTDGRLSRLDLQVCGWGDLATQQTYPNASPADIELARTYINGLAATSGGTNFNAAAQQAATFFDTTLATSFARRYWFFVTDGQPTGDTLDSALTTSSDLRDRSSGAFNLTDGTDVDIYGINIQDTSTGATGSLDNTPEDGVPVVDALDPDALLYTLLSGVFGQVIEIDGTQDWMQPNTPVFLENDTARELVNIIRVTGNVIYTDGALLNTFDAGTKVYGAVYGTFSNDSSLRAATTRVGLSRVEFDANVLGTYHEDWSTAPADTLNGLELLRIPHQWATDFTMTFEQPFEGRDMNRGPTERYFPVDFTTRIMSVRHVIRNEDHMSRVIGLFYRSRGKQKPFYCPTFIDEWRPVGNLPSVSQTMTIPGREFYDQFNGSAMYRYFQVVTPAFTYIRGITSMTVDGAGNTQITLDSIWSTDIDFDDIQSISWVVKCRFETDTLSLEWLTDGVAETTMKIRTLEDVA